MATGGLTFVIVDGVRRAKAFELAGAANIRARLLYADGSQGPVTDIPVASLFSPKSDIDMSSALHANRFWNIWRAVRAGKALNLPPIIVQRGSRGTPIKDVGWAY